MDETKSKIERSNTNAPVAAPEAVSVWWMLGLSLISFSITSVAIGVLKSGAGTWIVLVCATAPGLVLALIGTLIASAAIKKNKATSRFIAAILVGILATFIPIVVARLAL